MSREAFVHLYPRCADKVLLYSPRGLRNTPMQGLEKHITTHPPLGTAFLLAEEIGFRGIPRWEESPVGTKGTPAGFLGYTTFENKAGHRDVFHFTCVLDSSETERRWEAHGEMPCWLTSKQMTDFGSSVEPTALQMAYRALGTAPRRVEQLEAAVAAFRQFLVPWSHHLPESWYDLLTGAMEAVDKADNFQKEYVKRSREARGL